MSTSLQLYQNYFVDRQSDRPGLFRVLKDRYDIQSAIYPGSFVHIAPSLIYPRVAYIDNDRRVQKFFSDPDVLAWVNNNKEYEQDATLIAFQQNYSKPTPVDIGQFDLLISQYAGFVSQECKQYLKTGGLLLVNNSHADAGLAYLDPDYELVAVVNQNKGKWSLKEDGLEEYFIPNKGVHPSRDELQKTMRGVGYKKTATNYIFKKR